jgi:hypothetical protein
MPRPARQKRVIPGHVRICVNRDRGNMQLAALRPLIERLNVCQSMVEPITPQIDLILRHRIEHERVIGIGGMTQRKDFSALSGAAMHESFRRVHKFYAGSRAGGIKIGTSAA